MNKFNLLGHPEKLTRDITVRKGDRNLNKELALRFGKEYFDGDRSQGYGGYTYDGRWVPVAERLMSRYNLKPDSSVLDVGCAKGYLLQDLKDLYPTLDLKGIDISAYAKSCARADIQKLIDLGSCDKLPYDDNTFDCAVAINVIHNLDKNGCKAAIRELQRVTKNTSNIFVQVDAYNNLTEKTIFEDWVLTAKTYLMPEEWMNLFSELDFQGDFFWTVIGFTVDD